MSKALFRLTGLILCLALILHAQPVKIAVVGNSITEGAGVTTPSRDSYPAQLGFYLGEGYEVGNFGISGRTMLKHGDFPIWAEPKFEDALNFNADILIILLGTNDSKPQNWGVYGNEFIGDYLAMIDSFSLGPKIPEIWACLPPPAFSVQYGINDTVIVNEVIPAIEQVIADRNLNKIDFYTPFIGHNEYFPDDIHPNAAGSNVMAKIIYNALTGNTIPSKQDINVIKNKTILTETGQNGSALIDNDPLTAWTFSALPAEMIIDIGQPDSVDAFALNFPNSAKLGIQYKIEGSLDGTAWTLLVDESGRSDTENKAAAHVIDPVVLQYFRLTITGSTQPYTEISIDEFQVLAYHGSHHANIMTILLDRKSTKFDYYDMTFTPVHNTGEQTKLYKNAGDGKGFIQLTGYKSAEENIIYKIVIKSGGEHWYFTMSYMNGVEVSSDTLYISNLETSVVSEAALPNEMILNPNFPNPFNPGTKIIYSLNHHSEVKLTVFNSLGQKVKILVDEVQPAGQHMVVFDGSDMNSGVYLYILESEGLSVSRKMLLMK